MIDSRREKGSHKGTETSDILVPPFCGAVGFITGILILAICAAPVKPAQAFTTALLPLVTTVAMRIRSA